VVDILPYLEGLAYVGFIAGAIFAVMELRDIKRDRQIGLMTRLMEHGATREFQEPMGKIWRTKATDAQELEKEISSTNLYMVGEYWSVTAFLATSGLVKRKDLLKYMDYESLWGRMGPWITAERKATDSPEMWSDIEELAQLQKEKKGV
jgi:hypothetical protein